VISDVGKGQSIAQFLIETMVILLLAFLVSCSASYFAVMRLGVFLQDMVGAISIDFPIWKLLLQYAVEMLVAAIGVMIAAYPISQLHPKEILSKMSYADSAADPVYHFHFCPDRAFHPNGSRPVCIEPAAIRGREHQDGIGR